MRIKTFFIVLFLSFVVLGVYYPSLFAPFSSVDDTRMVNSLLNVERFSLWDIFFSVGRGQYYRPLLGLTFLVDRFVWGLEESFMHLENILLHMFNVILVFFITFRVYAGRLQQKKLVSAAAALLFALHPINTEAVNWISGRTDVLACFFILLAMLILLHSLENKWPLSGIAAALCYLLGCLSKESALFFLPAALYLIFVHPAFSATSIKAWRWKERWLSAVSFVAAAYAYFILRGMAFQQGDKGIRQAVNQVAGDPAAIWHNLYVILKVAGFYAVKLFMPLPLNFGIVTVPGWYLVPGVLLVPLAAFLLLRRSVVSGLFLSAFFIGSAALVIAIAKMSWTPVAERYMYIPCAAFATGIAVVATDAMRRRRLKTASILAFVIVLSVFSFATVKRNILWQDNLALAKDTARKSPHFGAAKNDIAVALLSRGRKEEALQIFQSNDVDKFQAASLNRVVVLIGKGRLDEARSFLRERLQGAVPYREEILNKLIFVDETLRDKSADPGKQRELNLEILDSLKMLHGLTNDPFCYYRMGRVSLLMGNRREAGEHFSKAWKDAPEGAYYKAPAGKLARDLLASGGGGKHVKNGN